MIFKLFKGIIIVDLIVFAVCILTIIIAYLYHRLK